MAEYQFSSDKMTVFVKTNERGIVVKTAAITDKFIGQHVSSLKNWIKKQGNFKEYRLKD